MTVTSGSISGKGVNVQSFAPLLMLLTNRLVVGEEHLLRRKRLNFIDEMRSIIELVYWIKIFLSPNFAALLIIAILYNIVGFFSYWYLLLFIPSLILGIFLAERARRKYGTSIYDAKHMNTHDITETSKQDKNS